MYFQSIHLPQKRREHIVEKGQHIGQAVLDLMGILIQTEPGHSCDSKGE